MKTFEKTEHPSCETFVGVEADKKVDELEASWTEWIVANLGTCDTYNIVGEKKASASAGSPVTLGAEVSLAKTELFLKRIKDAVIEMNSPDAIATLK